jgi:hypothetical protein
MALSPNGAEQIGSLANDGRIWAQWLDTTLLAPVPHRQVVLAIPNRSVSEGTPLPGPPARYLISLY